MRSFVFRILFIISGLLVGVALARFSVADYKHTSVVIGKGIHKGPLYISDYEGRQVIALSLKNLQRNKDIDIRMDGAEIQSWYPPPVKMPYYRWMDIEDGGFRGIEYGRRLPLYIVLNGDFEHGDLEIINPSDGSIIQSIHVMRGMDKGDHH